MRSINCKHCNKTFMDYLSNNRKFCSRSCKNKSQLGKSSWNKGKISGFALNKKNIYKGQAWNKGVPNSGFKAGYTPWNKGKELSLETRRKMSKSRVGEKNINWKGGVTPENNLFRKSLEYHLWRIAVLERDNFTCQICGHKGGKLHVDHIKPFSKFPELRVAIDNGRVLCIECHRSTETWGYRVFKCV